MKLVGVRVGGFVRCSGILGGLCVGRGLGEGWVGVGAGRGGRAVVDVAHVVTRVPLDFSLVSFVNECKKNSSPVLRCSGTASAISQVWTKEEGDANDLCYHTVSLN